MWNYINIEMSIELCGFQAVSLDGFTLVNSVDEWPFDEGWELEVDTAHALPRTDVPNHDNLTMSG